MAGVGAIGREGADSFGHAFAVRHGLCAEESKVVVVGGTGGADHARTAKARPFERGQIGRHIRRKHNQPRFFEDGIGLPREPDSEPLHQFFGQPAQVLARGLRIGMKSLVDEQHAHRASLE